MARFVNFGGQILFKPGALTRVDASGLSPIGSTATGVVHLIGEADGGAPGTEGVVVLDDPELAKSVFRSGPLADAVRLAFNPSNDPRVPGGASRVVAYKTNASTQSSTQLPGDSALVTDVVDTASTTAIVFDSVTLVASAHIGRWLALNGELRRITANTTTTVTVSPGFSATPTGGDDVIIRDSQIIVTTKDYGAHTTQASVEFEQGSLSSTYVVTLALEDTIEQSPELCGDAYMRIKYSGGPENDSGTVGTIASDGSTFQLDVTGAPSSNQYAGMMVRFSNGLQRLISSNDAADPSTITLAAGHYLSTAEAAEVNATTAQVIDVTAATVSITGANGKATHLTSTVTATSDNLNITFSPDMTLRQLVDKLNGTTNYEAVILDGINPDTTLVADFDYGTAATAVDVRFDDAISPTTKGLFKQDLMTVVNWINNFSMIATATRANAATSEGSELPVLTGGVFGTVRDVPVYLVGGTRGASTNTTFQTGFDELMQVRGNHIVPLISYNLVDDGLGSTATISSVAAQLAAHVQEARGIGKNEMGGYLGFSGTKAQIIAQANALNDTDVQLFPQTPTVLDVNGNLVQQPEWASAVLAAGMRSGTSEVGEPLTYKFVKVNGFDQDSSWSPSNRTDVNQLLQAGVMFMESVSGGVRWVDDTTTYVQDDNIAFMDGNTREVVRFIAYDLRTFLENRFTGLKSTPATVAAIRESTAAKMADYKTDNLIVASLDPETGTKVIANGYRNLRVFITGDVAEVRLEIFPVTGIKFILNSIFLSLPRLSA